MSTEASEASEVSEASQNATPEAGSAGGAKDPRELLRQMADSIGSLRKGLTAETQARRDLAGSITETLEAYTEAIQTIQTVLFSMLTLELDRSAPMRDHPDEQVAEVAKMHTDLALECQAKVAPELFENLYGIDAVTGELLDGGAQAGSE